MSLLEQIKNFKNKKKSLLFTTPSHAQGGFVDSDSMEFLGKKVFECDFSEIEGFDNLRHPENTLKTLLAELTKIYGSKQTFILTNGSSSGILAAMLSVLKDNDRVIIARNCHISVTNGLILTGAVPAWILPEYDKKWGVFNAISPDSVKKAIENNPDAKAVILTSPTYEGIFSDIEKIAKITHEAGMKLIVDEAHGALLPFGNFKTRPAIDLGADISVQSLHKTAGALTPAAVLHIGKNSEIAPETVQNALNLINTTSPSYPVMLSVENTVKYLASNEGKKAINDLQNKIFELAGGLCADFEVYCGNNDPTKILFRAKNANAGKIAEFLNNECAIEEEFTNGRALLFITGIGTTSEKLEALFGVLNRLKPSQNADKEDFYANYRLPEYVMRPKDAFYAKKERIFAANASGKVAAEPILNYPPGIPVLVPGERICGQISGFAREISAVV